MRPENLDRAGTEYWSIADAIDPEELPDHSNLGIQSKLERGYEDRKADWNALSNRPAMLGFNESGRLQFARQVTVFLSRCCHMVTGGPSEGLPTNPFGWVSFDALGGATRSHFNIMHITGGLLLSIILKDAFMEGCQQQGTKR